MDRERRALVFRKFLYVLLDIPCIAMFAVGVLSVWHAKRMVRTRISASLLAARCNISSLFLTLAVQLSLYTDTFCLCCSDCCCS